jgi:hypothetical protein
MSSPEVVPPSNAPDPAPDMGAAGVFNPFRLLEVNNLDRATLSRYAVFLVGLRRTLRGQIHAGAPPEARLEEFLTEVEEALSEALAARRSR